LDRVHIVRVLFPIAHQSANTFPAKLLEQSQKDVSAG
jgi:hypothetical protein